MSTTKAMPSDAQSFYNGLKDLEAKGGSAGYKTNPGNFQAYADEIHGSKSEDDVLVDRLQNIKSLNGQQGALEKVKLLVAFTKTSGDPLVSALAPKLESLQNHLGNGPAFDEVIKEAKEVADARRGPKTGYNPRVFETLELVEKLGGSDGFKKYMENPDAYGTGTTTGGNNPWDPLNIEDGESAPAVLVVWVRGFIGFIGNLALTSEIACCQGVVWGYRLKSFAAWGTLTINKKDLQDLILTFDRKHELIGRIVTPFTLRGSGDNVSVVFFDMKRHNIFAIFQSEKSTLIGDVSGQGVAFWKVKLEKFFHHDFMGLNLAAV